MEQTKNEIHFSAYTQPVQLIFCMVKYADNIYYRTEKQMRGLCVGEDMFI